MHVIGGGTKDCPCAMTEPQLTRVHVRTWMLSVGLSHVEKGEPLS